MFQVSKELAQQEKKKTDEEEEAKEAAHGRNTKTNNEDDVVGMVRPSVSREKVLYVSYKLRAERIEDNEG